MEIKKYQVENIIKTLPISYYLFKGLTVQVEEDEETSYTIPSKSLIVISMKNIQEALKNIDYVSQEQLEQDCRTILYHEVSHCLLTPEMRFDTRYAYDKINSQLYNIFEDERIETILKDYYKNVDFDSFKRRAIEDTDQPQDTMQKFFKVVRFRNYKPEVYNCIVEKLINDYKYLNSSDPIYKYNYLNRIKELYDLLELEEHYTKVDQESDLEENSTINKKIENLLQRIDESVYNPSHLPKNQEKSMSDLIVEAKQALSDKISNTKKNINRELEKLIIQSLRRKGNQSTSINGYHGRINPRLCGNDDYKWWVRQSQNGIWQNNSGLHINLFIDTSGSFIGNLDTVNNLIGSLHYLQTKYKGFTFKVFGIGHYDKINEFDQSKKCTYIPNCPYSSIIAPEIKEKFIKAQDRTKSTYNILLMDGGFSNLKIAKPLFNQSNSYIISDPDNSGELKRWKNAHTTITYNYTNELMSNVIKIINQMVA